MDQVVFREGMDPRAFLKAMDENFENTPELLYKLRNQCPKMGNDDDRADGFACRLLNLFADAVQPLRNERGGIYRAGTGAAMYYIWHAGRPGRHRRRRAEGHAPFRQFRAVPEREAQRPGIPAEILRQAGFLPGYQRAAR